MASVCRPPYLCLLRRGLCRVLLFELWYGFITVRLCSRPYRNKHTCLFPAQVGPGDTARSKNRTAPVQPLLLGVLSADTISSPHGQAGSGGRSSLCNPKRHQQQGAQKPVLSTLTMAEGLPEHRRCLDAASGMLRPQETAPAAPPTLRHRGGRRGSAAGGGAQGSAPQAWH